MYLLIPLLTMIGVSGPALTVYYALFRFSGYTVRNVGVFNTIQILWHIRSFLINRINFPTLPKGRNFIEVISPDVVNYLTEHLRNELLSIARRDLSNRRVILRIINILLTLTLAIPLRMLFKFIFRIAFRSIVLLLGSMFSTTLSIFWIEPLRNIQGMLNFGWILKELIESYLPFNLQIPIPQGVVNFNRLPLWDKTKYFLFVSLNS